MDPVLLRWLAAGVGLALVVVLALPAALDAMRSAVVLGGGEAVGEATETGRGAQLVEDGSATPMVDAAVRDGKVRDLAAAEVAVGAGGAEAFLLAFARIPGPLDCVAQVLLEITLVRADEGEVAAHLSGAFEPVSLTEGGDAGAAIPEGAPAALAFTNGTPGRLRWDVTGLYQRWVGGGPIGGGIKVPDTAPFTLAVRPTDPGSVSATLAAVDAGEDAAPTLTWTGVADCPGSG